MSPSGRYLAIVLALFVGLLAPTWVYTSAARRYFLDTGYGEWAAKLDMIRACDVGDTVVLGDSRAAAAFVPGAMAGDVRNLALSGSTAVEAYYEARAIFRCPRPPATVVVSFASEQFESIDWLWLHAVSYGQLGFSELQEIAGAAERLGETTLYRTQFGADPPPTVKNWLHANHFPAYDFAALLGSGGLGRARDNEAFRLETLADKGHHVMGTPQACAREPAKEVWKKAFRANPLVDHYVDRLLAFLHARGATVVLAATPISSLTQAKLAPAYADGYRDYLRAVVERHPWLRRTDDPLPVMDRCAFGDTVHLNQAGAVRFTARMAKAIDDLSRRSDRAGLSGACVQRCADAR